MPHGTGRPGEGPLPPQPRRAGRLRYGPPETFGGQGFHEEPEARSPLLKALLGAGVVALIGAWVWGLVIAKLDLEIGWLAWGIGGLIGFTFYKLGGEGGEGVLACGLLALAAIFGGKYIGASMVLDEIDTQMQEMAQGMSAAFQQSAKQAQREAETSGDPDMQAAAEAFVRLVGGETPTPASGAEDSYDEDWGDLEGWDEEQAEEMRRALAEAPNLFGPGGELSMRQVVSPWTLVKESLTFIDIIFVLLGVGTAMTVGSGRFGSRA